MYHFEHAWASHGVKLMIDQHPRCPTIYLECKINCIVKPDLFSFALPSIFSV